MNRGKQRVLLLDTNALVFDALEPARLSRRARAALEAAARTGSLACADISLWEIAMLIARKRIQAGADTRTFLEDVIAARRLAILPITLEIAAHAQSPDFAVGDPVDRIIAATSVVADAPLVTADRRLRTTPGLKTVW